MTRSNALGFAIAAALGLAACGEGDPPPQEYGDLQALPEPQRGLLPSMNIADPVGWGDARPVVPEGYEISRVDMVVRLRKKR